MTASAELKNAVAGLLGLPAAELGKDIKPDPHFEALDPFTAQEVTERFFNSKDAYIAVEQANLGHMTKDQFKERIADIFATLALNIQEEKIEEEHA